MLLIGIAGANPLARERVAKAMKKAGVCGVSVYSDAPENQGTSHNKAKARLKNMNEMIAATPANGAECLVVADVVHESQARRIRQLGGCLVHVEGRPSDEVVIRRGDLLVTATKGGDRHFIDGEAALSELWVSKGAV